jgi:hypothetical protein
MTYKELEVLVLALSPAEAGRLVNAISTKLEGIATANRAHDDTSKAVRETVLPYDLKEGAYAMEAQVRLLLERLAHLPPERQAEVSDFIEFLHQRELAHLTSKDVSRASESAFAKVWDNDDDALYDKL